MLITQQCRVAQNLQFIKTHNNVKQNKEVCLYLDTSLEFVLNPRVPHGTHLCCAVLLLQLCPTLCDPMGSSPGSSVHGILQPRILELVAISFSRGSSQLKDQIHISCGSLIVGGFFIAEPRGKPMVSSTVI